MADNRRYAQLQPFRLAGSGAAAGSTSLILRSFQTIGGVNLVMATDFGTKAWMTLEPGTTREEQISFTGITQNPDGTATLTGVSNVAFTYPYTETAGTVIPHAGGVLAIVSDNPGLWDSFANKENNEVINEQWTFNSSSNGAAPQVDNVAYNPAAPEYIHRAFADANYGGSSTIPQVSGTGSGTSGNVQVNSLNFAVPSSGVNRGILVQISTEQVVNVTGVTYNGVALTQVVATTDVPNNLRNEQWFLAAPALGNNNVVISLSGNAYIVAGAEVFVNIDQTSPTGATQTSSGNSTTPSLVLVTTQDNSVVADGVTTALAPLTYTPGTAQTLNWSESAATDTRQGASSYEPAGSFPDNITMDWTLDTGTDWIQTAVELLAVQTSSGSANTVSQNVTQTGHGLSVDEIVRSNGTDGQYTKSQSDTAANAEVTGIVSSVPDANNFTIVTEGFVTLSALPGGAVAGDILFLDPSTAGALTLTEPTIVGQVTKPLAEVIDASTNLVYFHNYRGKIIPSGTSSSGLITYGTATRGAGDATGSQVIAHGLGTTPAYIKLTAFSAGTSGGPAQASSIGIFDGTNFAMSYSFFNSTTVGGSSAITTELLRLQSLAGSIQRVTSASLDATNITLGWVLNGAGAPGTIGILWEAYA